MMHVLNAAVDHEAWCEWVGLIPGLLMPLTGELKFRCPGCWGAPAVVLDESAGSVRYEHHSELV